jgi:hypothetical protein
VIERPAGQAGMFGRTIETLDPLPTPGMREARLRQIAQALNRSRAEIWEMLRRDPLSREAESNEVAGALRDAHPADRPPEFEGFVLDSVLRENQQAIANMRRNLHQMNPDVIVGIERGGVFFVEALALGDPVLAGKVRTMREHLNPDPNGRTRGAKFDAAAQQAEFQALIDQGANRIVVVDALMGGHTGRALLNQVFIPLAERNPNVHFETYWIRETMGYEVLRGGGVEPSGTDFNPLRSMRQRYRAVADRISMTRMERVRMVLGDDMEIIFTPGAGEPIRIFDAEGRVTEVFRPRPGQTTRDVLIALMNGVIPADVNPRSYPPIGSHIPGRPPPIQEDTRIHAPLPPGRR